MVARNLTVAAIAALGLLAAAAGPVRSTILPIDDVSPSVVFLDDFEDGGLSVGDVPPGRWDGVDAVPGTDAVVSTLAARSGNRSLRISDVTDLPDKGTTISPYVGLGTGTGDRYLRAWVRVAETADSGTITILQLLHGPRSVADVNLTFPPGGILLAGDNADGGYPVFGTGALIGSGWRLLEVGVIDAGTPLVTRVLWVDGAQVGQQRINQSGWTVDELDVGEPWADDGTFQGTIDFDGVAVTTDPPPSHVEVDAGSTALAAGVCRPVAAKLMSSSRVPAGALRPDRLTLSVDVDGGAAVATYADPDCAVAGATLDVDAGTTEVAFGIVGLAPGFLTISAGSQDLIANPINKTVLGVVDGGIDGGNPVEDAGTTEDAGTSADAGTEDGGHGGDGDAGKDAGAETPPPEDLAVCGCGAAGGPWSAAAAVLLALALQLRRSSARPATPPRPGRGRSGRRSRTARCGG
jgi:hypothetical protein